MAYKVTDILQSFTQRRQSQWHDVETVIQVFAEQTLLDLVSQVAVCRRNDAHISADRRPPPDRRVLALLQHAQKSRLSFHWHIAYFIKKQRAAFGLLKAPLGAHLGTGEGPPFS